jgi:hypothetical protein
MKQRKGKFWSGVVVMLVAAGITASAAQGRVLLSGGGVDAKSYPEIRSESRVKGIELRSFAPSQQYGEIRSESLSKLQSAETLGALAVRSEGMNQKYGQFRTESTSKDVVGPTSGGFDWSDAGIGAGVAFASALLVGAAGLARRRQTQVLV